MSVSVRRSTKLFVAGPPGTGKTFAGNELGERFGWTHIDVEWLHQTMSASTFTQFLNNPTSFFPRVEPLVVTWGYIPEFGSTAQRIVEADFLAVWLTGDEQRLQTVVERRGINPELPFPPNLREVTEAARQFISGWWEIDVFNVDGTRRDVAQVLNGTLRNIT